MESVSERARLFGLHLHRIRTEVFGQSLRDFAKTIDLSPSYIGKLENGEVAAPKRQTLVDIAAKTGMDVNTLLLKAGYVPDDPVQNDDDAYLLMLLGTLTPEQREAVRVYIGHVKDLDIRRSVPATIGVVASK